jgi:hypothetical protein
VREREPEAPDAGGAVRDQTPRGAEIKAAPDRAPQERAHCQREHAGGHEGEVPALRGRVVIHVWAAGLPALGLIAHSVAEALMRLY